MSLEIEAKIKVDDHATCRQRLTELGARRIGRVRETNRILDDEGKTLRRSGKGLRVRHIEVLDGPPGPSSISYKGPVQRAGRGRGLQRELRRGKGYSADQAGDGSGRLRQG